MADSAAEVSQETSDSEAKPAETEARPVPTPSSPIAVRVSQMSDRAIQRVVGGNAFLRGRLYARRKSVEGLNEDGDAVRGEIAIRSQEEPYRTEVTLQEDSSFVSGCTCPGWRGPTGHCKHVAAVLVALRDIYRPPRPRKDPPPEGQSKKKRRKKRGDDKTPPVHVPQTVSVGGKRRRSRRRRRGGNGAAEKLEVVSARDLAAPMRESRGAIDAWLPPDALAKPYDFEYRVIVRTASITITPVVAGTRNAVPINEALAAFNMIPAEERPLMRALARNVGRGSPATAELRGEDAAEILNLLRDRRALLEPASMELRFSDEHLVPRIELDLVNSDTLRTRVVFEQPSSGRKFPLSSGAWFEGTPGWHIEASDGVARPVAESVTPGWLTRLYRSPALVHPIADMPRLLADHIPRVAVTVKAELPDLSSFADVVDAHPTFQLWAEGNIVEASATIKVVYGDTTYEVPPDDFPSPLAFLPSDEGSRRPKVIRRDVGAEMSAVQNLMNRGFEVENGVLVAHGEEAIEFWSQGLGELPEEWDRFVPDDLVDITIRNDKVTPQVRVSSGVDWLSLDMSFKAGRSSVSEEELRACLESGRRIVQLSDGTYAPVDPDQVGEVLARMAEIYASAGQKKKLPLSQAGRVQDLLQLVPNAKVAATAKTLFAKLENISDIPKIAKPRSLKATLRPYQKAGFNWLVFLDELASGGILADDMGLGKTLQTIALLLWSRSKHKRRLNIVIAPTSVVPNWEREIQKFAPSTFKCLVWQGPNRFDLKDKVEDTDVLITSYALLRRDEEFLGALNPRYVILDEAQHIKNPMSHTARAAKKLPSERRLALTGTPIENRLSEMWSIFDFVSPGLLGELKTFEERIARPIDRGDQETADRLRRTIQPFVLRRLKIDVADDLPPKIEQEIVVPMSDEQAALYKKILQEVRKNVLSEVEKKGIAKSQIQILAALTRLRQVACDPRLMKLETQEFTAEMSGKLGALREIIENAIAGGHRVLVFSQFVTMLTHIRTALEEDGVEYEYLDGSTKDRMGRVERFNEDDSVPVFLISLKAGGTGLNLVGADTVVHFDPWWNPAVEDQATDRAHRIGQSRVVNVYRLIAKTTVEEKILELSGKKRALMENVLSTEGSPLKGLTKKDVDALFSD